MLSEKRIIGIANDLAGYMPGYRIEAPILFLTRFARFVEAAVLENAAKQDAIRCHNMSLKSGINGPHAAWAQGCSDMTAMLRARARAARKAAFTATDKPEERDGSDAE